MKIILRLLIISVCFIVCSSCSKDDDDNPIVGNWDLVNWSVGIPFDIDQNISPSSNFLEHTSCAINETVTFDDKGTVIGKDTFNPEITISLKDNTSDVFFVEEICAEGSIGFSTSYVEDDNKNIDFNGATGSLSNQKLTLVYANAVKIYNEALTEVIDTKDLTLVYLKKE